MKTTGEGLPVLIAAREGGARPRPGTLVTADACSLQSKRPIVLFVEDQPMVRYTLVERLSDEGFEVIQCETGEDALALLNSAAVVDALLTDLRLPGFVDGWDVAEAARKLRPDLPVIYVSAYSYASPRQVPGSVMLDKPVAPEAVIEALDSLLD